MRNDARADAKHDVKPDARPDRDRPSDPSPQSSPELRGRFGLHAIPFTREIRVEEQMHMPFADEALDGLFNAVDQRSSAALVAPAGTGKTALLRRLVARLPEARYQVRYVKVTSLSKRDMCREIAAACGIPPVGAYPFLVRGLQERFETCASTEGLRPVLLLDESHELRPDVLGILRIITNFEMDSRLVLSVVLAGQPALQTMLAREDQQAVTRRLSHCATLRLLSRDETAGYVAHRSAIAGAMQPPFDAPSVDALYELSRGNMRAIDQLALKSLQAAARANADVVSSPHVLAARKDLWL
jgi:type II secretory pathway predicted ATPase ExeA